MKVNEPRVTRQALESVVVPVHLLSEIQKNRLLHAVFPLKDHESPIDILLLKDFPHNFALSILHVIVRLCIGAQKHLYDLNPILLKDLCADLMRMNAVAAKPLHTEVIDKPVLLDHFNLFLDLSVTDLPVNEPKSDGEPVSVQLTEHQRLKASLE